jgi:uncharacterized heparinase superfamily protein
MKKISEAGESIRHKGFRVWPGGNEKQFLLISITRAFYRPLVRRLAVQVRFIESLTPWSNEVWNELASL